jgi:hypothetical protein
VSRFIQNGKQDLILRPPSCRRGSPHSIPRCAGGALAGLSDRRARVALRRVINRLLNQACVSSRDRLRTALEHREPESHSGGFVEHQRIRHSHQLGVRFAPTLRAGRAAIVEAGTDVVGTNCGVGVPCPATICRHFQMACDLPIWIKPNVPRVEGTSVRYGTTAEFFASHYAPCEIPAPHFRVVVAPPRRTSSVHW